MKLISKIQNWLQDRRDRRAQALGDGYIDIVVLYKKGLLSTKATGQSITDISAEICSQVKVPLRVIIPHGTYFISQGNHQNMVTRRTYKFELEAQGTKRIHVPASCINASLPIPEQQDRFNGVARVSESVRRFLEAAEGEHEMVIQAGVWALTDGYSREQIQQTLRTRRVPDYRFGSSSSYGSDEGPAISTAQINRAKQILDQLKIRHGL